METTMIIYRIEHEKNGLGPYQNFITEGKHYNMTNCPSPDEDGIDWVSNARYGFKSKKDLLKWFSKDSVWEFKDYQHHVYKYRVPSEYVSVGGKHVAFRLRKATKLGKVPMYKLH
jgi:hypothetical protein